MELPSGHCFLVWFPPLSSTFTIILKVTHISLIDSLRWNSVSLIFYSVASPHLGRLNECVCVTSSQERSVMQRELTSLTVLQKLKHIRKLVLERKLLTIYHVLNNLFMVPCQLHTGELLEMCSSCSNLMIKV